MLAAATSAGIEANDYEEDNGGAMGLHDCSDRRRGTNEGSQGRSLNRASPRPLFRKRSMHGPRWIQTRSHRFTRRLPKTSFSMLLRCNLRVGGNGQKAHKTSSPITKA